MVKRAPRCASLFVLLGFLALLLGCERADAPSAAGSATQAGPKTVRIAVIPKGTTHEFWKSIHAGAVKASRELGVEIVWKGPLKEDDLKSQVDLVESFTAQGVSGIVLAPLNDKGLVRAVKDAVRSRVPVVVIDSGLQGTEHTSTVATDNLVAGRLAGQRMVELVGGRDGGKTGIVMLRYLEGSASTAERESGFLEIVRKQDGIGILSDNQYGGATTESAFAAAESLLLAQKAATGHVAGVFCPNESTTFGMLLAIEKLGLGGKISFVGFDASNKLVKGLEGGAIQALVVQDPFRMGYLGVQTMVQHLRGERVAERIDTGSVLVDARNMTEPAIKDLLRPDLRTWLGE